MKNYRDNGEGVKHGVLHLQLRRPEFYEIIRTKEQEKSCLAQKLRKKTKNNYRRQVSRERTNENIK